MLEKFCFRWILLQLLALTVAIFFGTTAFAATISGSVSNPTNKAGRVYVKLYDQNSNRTFGVSKTIAASGGTATYTISGVSNGAYTLSAFLDTLYGGKDSGFRHANDAYVQYGTTLNVSGSNLNNLDMTLSKQTAIPTTPLADFANNILVANDGSAALVMLENLPQSGGLPIPEAVELTCSGSGLASTKASIIVKNYSNMALFNGLTPGGTLSCTAVPVVNGSLVTAQQRISTKAITAVTTPGATVTGSYRINGITPGATTPLYFVLFNDSTGFMNLGTVPAPTASGGFTINNVPPGSFRIGSFVDSNNSHTIDAGDLDLNEYISPVVVVDGAEVGVPVKAGKLVFARSGSHPSIQVNHTIDARGAVPAEGYSLLFSFRNNFCYVANVSLANGANGALPLSPVSLVNSGEGMFEYWTDWFSNRPDDTGIYQAAIEYSDTVACPNETVPLQVFHVNDSFARPSYPRGTIVDNPSLNAAWRVPNPPPYTFYEFEAGLGFDNNTFPPSTLSSNLGSLNSSSFWQLRTRDLWWNTASWLQPYSLSASGPAISGFNPAVGPAGTTVIISGSGFKPTGGTPVVKFNGVAATVSASSDTSITVTVPPDASLGPITVTSPQGITAISSTEFTPTTSFAASGTNQVRDSSNTPVQGVFVHAIGVPTASATTNATGNYSIAALTSGLPLEIKMSRNGYLDTYSNFQAFTANVTNGNYGMFTATDLSNWNVSGVDWSGTLSAAAPPAAAMSNVIAGSRGIIRTRIASTDSVNSGVVVQAWSFRYPGQTYKVVYANSSLIPDLSLALTGGNGVFLVLDVEDGDFVTVSAQKNGYVFRARGYNVRAGAVSQGQIQAAPDPIVTIGPIPNSEDVPPLAVTLTAATAQNNEIFYTLDGSDPRYFGYSSFSPCTSPCTVNLNPSASANITVRAVAMAAGVYGGESAQTYNLVTDTNPPITTASTSPVLPPGGLFASGSSVTVTLAANEPATIYYTTNGSTPTTTACSSGCMSATAPVSFQISGTTTVKFLGKDTAGNTEAVNSVTYSFAPSATVKIDGDATPYYSINTALAGIVTPGIKTVRARGQSFTEQVLLNKVGTTILFKGGWNDSFLTQPGYTTIAGTLKIRNGIFKADRLKVK